MSDGIPPRVLGLLADNLGPIKRLDTMSITIKAGTSFDSPWFVTDSTDLATDRARLLEFADLTEKDELPGGKAVCESSLLDLTIAIARMFQGTYSARQSANVGSGSKLPTKDGGKVAPTKGEKAAPAEDTAGDEAKAEEALVKELIDAVEATTSKAGATELFKSRMAQMKDRKPVMDALQKKATSFA